MRDALITGVLCLALVSCSKTKLEEPPEPEKKPAAGLVTPLVMVSAVNTLVLPLAT